MNPPNLLPAFGSAPALQRLRQLARQPHDLAAPGGLTPARIAAFRARACELDLLYATQRVTPEVMAALRELASERGVIGQFQDMLRGDPVNRIEGHASENRRVLHVACRALFDDLPDRPGVGLPADATGEARVEAERLARFLEQVDRGDLRNDLDEPFTELINVGIGGSDLGPRALYGALQPWRFRNRRVHFLSNVDPDDAAQILRQADLRRTLVAVVSKSGTTAETRTNEALLRTAFRRVGLNPANHFLSITTPGTPMDGATGYRQTFHFFDHVGGRYSATSMVGGVSLGFGLGWHAFRELLHGAREMDLASQELDLDSNLPLLLALLGVWNRNLLGMETVAVIPYSQGLGRFVAHLQQLDMESNGKSVTRSGELPEWDTGPVIWGEPGTNAQHAFFQLLHQGPRPVPCELIGFRESQYGEDLDVDGTTSQQKLLANLLGQAIALATGQANANPNRRFSGNRPSLLLLGQRLTPRVVGRLLALYEHKVAYQGFLWGINSFDQEGVQLGKVVANRLLPHLKAGAPAPAPRAALSVEQALLRAAGLGPK